MKKICWFLLLIPISFVGYCTYVERTRVSSFIEVAISMQAHCQENCSQKFDSALKEYDCKYLEQMVKDYSYPKSPITVCFSLASNPDKNIDTSIFYLANDKEFLAITHYITDGDIVALGGKDQALIIKKYFNEEFNGIVYQEKP